ncbi:ABC transporter permease [Nakamurella flavida]|uniref:Transport permease protein n=1 Tax=Nakamurella flavida TaxID=363630 RepID=A0A938YNG1_9ACTN|nr:ABC transporter permease [Nakamurella flavida]MBM9478509.1 ABC transporter permease [Nakamurella flavida]MDP9777664.1 ABC-2 type transport system permease protein [Nakamurella flavida]
MSVLSDLRGSREILGNLTMREVRGKYKRSFLGQAWSLLNPIASLAIYTVVFGFVLRAQPAVGDPSGIDNFTLWLACALLPWNFFSNTVNGGMNALLGNSNLLQKVYFPRYTLVASNMLASLVTFGFELLVLAVVAVIFGSQIWFYIPLIAVFVLLLAAFGLGIGLMLSIANVYFRDTAQFVGIGMQVWFYLTPIVYPVSLIAAKEATWRAEGNDFPLTFLYRLNPTERFATVFRNLIYDNRVPDWSDMTYCLGAAVVSLALGAWVFSRFQGKVAEEL